MSAAAGTNIGDCEILQLLGAGGMGEVYRARDQSLDRELVVKLITKSNAPTPKVSVASNRKRGVLTRSCAALSTYGFPGRP
jgi:serine/threonine protein kinase